MWRAKKLKEFIGANEILEITVTDSLAQLPASPTKMRPIFNTSSHLHYKDKLPTFASSLHFCVVTGAAGVDGSPTPLLGTRNLLLNLGRFLRGADLFLVHGLQDGEDEFLAVVPAGLNQPGERFRVVVPGGELHVFADVTGGVHQA